MYSVDDKDTVMGLMDVPQSSVGAPLPLVVSDEHTLLLAYLVQRVEPDWDGRSVRIVGLDAPGEEIALVRFKFYQAYMFGPPNDEAFHGHPLASRGLSPYSVSEVRHSSWIRRLERMNAVHRHHQSERFAEYRHLIFALHDSTFECVAPGFTFTLHQGSLASLLPEMVKSLSWAV